jgi:CheY-like chemotaxis protein
MEMPHILVADDDPDTRELVEIVLRRADFRVTVTDDPCTVVELLATGRFDALLLDNRMPKINGIELCRVIRSVNEEIVIFFCLVPLQSLTKRLRLLLVPKGILQSRLRRTNSLVS